MLLLPVVDACQETAWSAGHLARDSAIDGVTLLPGRGSSCVCCSYCNSNADCASLGYNTVTRECLLFDSVANYSTIIADDSWRYFVMPSRSQHHQFCRHDSDCLATGDFCRGRVCTALAAITCRVIYEELGAGERLGAEIGAFGWLGAQEARFVCRMRSDWPGFTRVFRNQDGRTAITRDNVRAYNVNLAAGYSVHAGLEWADAIRQLRSDGPYQLRTVAKCADTAPFDDELVAEGDIERDQPPLVAIANATAVSDTLQPDFPEIPALSLPYLLHSGEDVVSVKVLVQLADGRQEQVPLPLARTDGLLWFHSVAVFIRE